MTNTSTEIVCMDRLLLSAMKAAVNDAGSSELPYSVSCVEARIKSSLDDMTLSRYLAKRSSFSYSRYVRFGRMMTRNPDVSPLLVSLNEGRKRCKELGISHLEKEVLHAIRSSFVILLIEMVDFSIDNSTKSTALHALRFYQFGK